jgi:hypothetical protein
MVEQPYPSDQAEPATVPPAKRRKRFGLSLRVLMLLVLLLGGGLGWLAYWARVQREAVAAIEAAGGTVFYDLEWAYGEFGPKPRKSRWPKRLVKLVGPDYLGHVMAVQFLYGPSNKADDEVMAQIGRLGHLEDLEFAGPDYNTVRTKGDSLVTDAGIAHLQGLNRLRRLRLYDTADQTASKLSRLAMLEELIIESERLTDAGLVYLAPLKQLKRLDLQTKKLTAEGLAQLIGFNRLESLYLWVDGLKDYQFLSHFPELTKLTLTLSVTERNPLLPFERERTPRGDFGLASLGTLSKLRELTVFGNPYPDGMLAHIGTLEGLEKLDFWLRHVPPTDYRQIARLSRLKHLSLMASGINDESLIHLSDLKGLKSLGLPINPITDAGLAHLSALTQLESLQLDHTRITDAGLIHLLPLKNCKMLSVTNTGVTVDGFSDFQAKREAQ